MLPIGSKYRWLFMVLIGLVSCATEQTVQLDLKKDLSANQAQQSSLRECEIRIADITDRRKHVKDIGLVGNQAVSAPDAADWLRMRLHRIENRCPSIPARRTITVNVELLKMYIHNIRGNTAANIVLAMQYDISDGERCICRYRGSSTSVNWWGTKGEYRAEFERALDSAITKIQADLVELCSR